MSIEKVYLKSNVVAEPLIAGWYAWSHLISPATACMNIKNRLLPIMKDYIHNPRIHSDACKDPRMTGGPFIDLNGERIDDVRKLLLNTLKNQSNLIAFASALEELDQLLLAECDGFSLDRLYPKIPSILKGYVELIYDLHNNASYRLFESLLYKSQFYDSSIQSLLIYLIYDDSRPYVLSTPRLENINTVHLNIPFCDEGIDYMFKMLRTPQTFSSVVEKMQIPDEKIELFKTFFTTELPKSYVKYEGNSARVRYFGHACILIETSEISILLDPVISYGYDVELSRLTYIDLPDEIDYVLITHNHQDHVLLETMLQLRHKVKNWIIPSNGGNSLIDPSLKLMLNNIGFEKVTFLYELEDIKIPNGKITGLPFLGEHGSLDIASKLGYCININDFKILCLADSQNLEFLLYEHIHNIIGDIDVLFLGMECNGAPVSWMYGPYFPEKLSKERDNTRRIAGANFEEAIDIVNRFNVKEAYVYAMGMEPWIKFLSANIYTPQCEAIVQSNIFLKECKSRSILAERLYGEKEILKSF